MAYIQCYSLNRSIGVEQIADDLVRASCRLVDTLMDALVEITVKTPDLEITAVGGEVRRGQEHFPEEPYQVLQKVLGVRVGPGMLKIFKGLIGTGPESEELRFMLEECCEGVILSITKEVLAQAPLHPDESVEYFKMGVKANPRLYNQCAAFRPDSSLVAGVEPPA